MNEVLLHCICRLLALSGGSQGGEFTSAFGGAAEVNGRTASAAFDANDRTRTLATQNIALHSRPLPPV